MVNLQLWSQMAPQCTTSGQSHSPLPRQQKSLQRLQPTFCFVYSHTCKFGGKNHGTCSGSFHTEIPAIHNILELDTYTEPSWAIILIHTCLLEKFNFQALAQTSWKKKREFGDRKFGNLYFYQTILVDSYTSSQAQIHWLAFQDHKDILKHCRWLIPLWSSKECEWNATANGSTYIQLSSHPPVTPVSPKHDPK